MPRAASPSARTPQPARVAPRYAAVTVLAAAVNQVCYAALLAGTAWPATLCTAVAAATVAVPTFVVLARWVWHVRRPPVRHAAAYVSSTAANVVLAATAVWSVSRVGAPHAVLVVTPSTVYALSWVARFHLLDRALSRAPSAGGPSAPCRRRGRRPGRGGRGRR